MKRTSPILSGLLLLCMLLAQSSLLFAQQTNDDAYQEVLDSIKREWRFKNLKKETSEPLNFKDTATLESKLKNPEYKNRFIEGFTETVGSTVQKNKDSISGMIPKYKKGMIRRAINQELRTRFDSLGLLADEEIDTSKYKNFKNINGKHNIKVFGWHPYWMGNAYKAYNFDLLSLVSYFSYDLNPETGGYRSDDTQFDVINSWRSTEMVELAHEKNCKVLLTISNHGTRNNLEFFNNPLPDLVQQNLIDSVFALLELKEADGINLNFENVPDTVSRQYNRFILNMSNQLRKRNPAWLLTVTLPPTNRKGLYDFLALNGNVDLFVIMGYDYNGPRNGPGPVAPLLAENPNGYVDLSNTLKQYLDAGIQPADLLLGLPYYGAMWEVGNGKTRFMNHLTYRQIRSDYLPVYGNDVVYDDSTQSNNLKMYYAGKDGPYLDLWFDDARSIRAKYDWIVDQQIGGVGIWALGYDNGYDDLWMAIDDKFTEVKIPPSNRIHITVIRAIRKYSTVIIASLVFLVIFMLVGFVYSLVDWKVRESIFQARTSRLIYLGLFFAMFLITLSLFGLLPRLWIWIVLGLITGLVLTMLVTRWVGFQYNRRP